MTVGGRWINFYPTSTSSVIRRMQYYGNVVGVRVRVTRLFSNIQRADDAQNQPLAASALGGSRDFHCPQPKGPSK